MQLKHLGLQKRTLNALAKKDLYTVNDMLLWQPRSYRNYTRITPLSEAVPDTYCAIKGVLVRADKRYGSTRPYIVLRLLQSDNIGMSVMYFVRTDLFGKYAEMKGEECVVCGKLMFDPSYGYSMSNPDRICLANDFVPSIDRIYPSIKGVSDKTLREIIDRCLEAQTDPLGQEMPEQMKVMEYTAALKQIHHPTDLQMVKKARNRIVLNDLLYFAMMTKRNDRSARTDSLIRMPKRAAMDDMIRHLPFELTKDQSETLDIIYKNANSGKRNNILLQGDVGCGKTIVAIMSMILAWENGYQSVLMAPREVLAAQHYHEIKGYAEKLGIKTAFLHSGMKTKEKAEIYKGIASGEISMVAGTHSCIAESVSYAALGIIITDEEHLFGVAQKEALEKKAMDGVHNLSMSATPIPRTLASVVYGAQKEICIIKTMPKGRVPIKTCIQRERSATLKFMEAQIRAGHQCYVVCPAIEENEEIELVSIETVEALYRSYFEPKGIRVGVVNGKMKKEEIDEVIKGYVDNRYQVLLSTTVIEVGVNVPNATVMVIEQADRFGLASLHQLRGRVGRSTFPSYCVLLSAEEKERLDIMVQTTDGFRIAEADLRIRGSGDLVGYRQAGNNQYVTQMLRYPALYQYACKVADHCLTYGLGQELIDLYAEHELLASGVKME